MCEDVDVSVASLPKKPTLPAAARESYPSRQEAGRL